MDAANTPAEFRELTTFALQFSTTQLLLARAQVRLYPESAFFAQSLDKAVAEHEAVERQIAALQNLTTGVRHAHVTT